MALAPDGLAIRWVEVECQPVNLQPGDVIVLMLPQGQSWSLAQRQNVVRNVRAQFPQNSVLILDDGLRLGVLRPEPGTSDDGLLGH